MATIEQTSELGGPPATPVGHDPHGHPSATGVTNTKLGIWLFLSSDCLFFGAFISAYMLYRSRSQGGPKATDVYDIPFTSVTSFVLLMSSLTMVLALAAIQRGDLRRLRIWLFATAALGAVFISGQVFEFTEFSRKGLDLGTNLFGTTFFVLTGFHGAHVSIGIIWLLSLWGIATQGRLQQADAEKVEIAGLYWHFVDVVWIVIFTVVYLIPSPHQGFS
jgi:cytochrome c oxidase subunit 3/cytochrome o ubiquinol oxidase subunit 3